jgi:hypothetical protein
MEKVVPVFKLFTTNFISKFLARKGTFWINQISEEFEFIWTHLIFWIRINLPPLASAVSMGYLPPAPLTRVGTPPHPPPLPFPSVWRTKPGPLSPCSLSARSKSSRRRPHRSPPLLAHADALWSRLPPPLDFPESEPTVSVRIVKLPLPPLPPHDELHASALSALLLLLLLTRLASTMLHKLPPATVVHQSLSPPPGTTAPDWSSAFTLRRLVSELPDTPHCLACRPLDVGALSAELAQPQPLVSRWPCHHRAALRTSARGVTRCTRGRTRVLGQLCCWARPSREASGQKPAQYSASNIFLFWIDLNFKKFN